jgi:hypothetical protein
MPFARGCVRFCWSLLSFEFGSYFFQFAMQRVPAKRVRSLVNWSTKDVLAWLDDHGLAQFHANFAQVKTGEQLRNLTALDLVNMGVLVF